MCYIAGEKMTLKEQLFPYKTRWPFLQYIGNKPDKFVIRFWFQVDVESKYSCEGLIWENIASD